MGLVLVELLLIGYLPGALVFRLPYADRERRAGLPAEERFFWATVISVAISCAVVLLLAAANRYTFRGLVLADVGICAALAAVARGNLRLGLAAQRPRPAAVIPVALVVLGLWLYFPPAQYLLGGRDPGIYTIEGIQIAQSGSLSIPDSLVSSLPERFRDLFFPVGFDGYRNRFLGFFILDIDKGMVGGRFPQFYPASLAIAYGIDGLRGVGLTSGVWAILGVLAVYFAGAWLLGRPTAAVAAGVLSLHVAQVWFGRYPNAELPMQALLFAGLLAYARMETDDGGRRFFAMVAAGLLGLLIFLRVDAALVLACVAASVALNAAMGRRVTAWFLAPLVALSLVGLAYMARYVGPYIGQLAAVLVENATPAYLAVAVAALVATSLLLVWASRHRAATQRWLPIAAVVFVFAGALYAYFFREPGGRLAPHDAYALRTFTEHYLTPYVLAIALVGYAIAVPRVFWKSSLMVLLMTGFCAIFFYKIRIVPEHFWMARRFLPVILPAFALFAGAALFHPSWTPARWLPASVQRVRAVITVLVVGLAAGHFLTQTWPILRHVEYAGIGPRLEESASRIGDRDLVIIEPAVVSDNHILGVPLAFIYGRQVLVLDSASPDKAAFADFLEWARGRYRNVEFLGGGGTDLLSDATDAELIWVQNFELPEYEQSTGHTPRVVKLKRFEFGVYRLTAVKGRPDHFQLEIGGADDFYVTGFYGKEHEGPTRFRWTSARSQIRLRATRAEPTSLTLWVSKGGRPAGAGEAKMTVRLGGRLLGSVVLDTPEFRPYTFAILPGAVDPSVTGDGLLTLTIETPTWSPRREDGGPDARELGILVSRVELR